MPDLFALYDEAGQPQVPIEGYASTARRDPFRPPFHRPQTRTELTGPLDLAGKLGPGACNLAKGGPGRVALGQLIHLGGRVLDEEGRPVAGAVVEIWQANEAGRYRHASDRRDAPLDPNFAGYGRTRTDQEGRFGVFTIKPRAYPVPESGRWWRPPHIHLSVLGPSASSRLVTRMYFPGETLNGLDRLLLSVPDPVARERLVAHPVDPREVEGEWVGFAHDLVLRGRRATPALA